ncbi:MAG: thioredoxin family protein [Alloprevotella sp.]|nr:thioredoxin family protein [Alloprevotella sp.]
MRPYKLFLLFTAGFLASAGLSAQDIPSPRAEGEQVWWGYYTPDMSVNAVGTGWSVTYDVAAFIPGGEHFAKGATISGLRFSLPNTPNLTDVKVWVATALPNAVDRADVLVQQVATNAIKRGATNEVLFDEPYTVTAQGAYIGYSLTISSVSNDNDLRPIAYSADVHPAGSLYLRTSEGLTTWEDYSTEFGALAIQALFGGRLAANAVGAVGSERVSATRGTETTVPVTLTNYSPGGVRTISYTVSGAGTEETEREFTLPEPFMALGDFTLKLPVAVGDVGGDVRKQLTVTKVNGEPNTVTDAQVGIELTVLTETLPKKVLVEEFSGTWCLWCPMGARGIELAQKKFGDRMIAVEVHDQDIMWDSSLGYDPLIAQLIGVPACFINRGPETDPYYGSAGGDVFGLDADIEEELSRTAEAAISLEAEWETAAKNALRATAHVTFQTGSEVDYALGYIVTADQLTGTGKDWVQSNGLSGDSSLDGDENLQDLVNGPKNLTDYVFHDVAVAAAGVQGGVKGSVASPVKAGVAQTHSQRIDLSENKLIQDKNALSLVCFLINTETGRIVNAERVHIGDGTDGISTVSTAPATAKVYDLQGRRLRKPARGMNILHYNDGTTRKTINP